MTRQLWASCIALLLVMVTGVAYLAVGLAHIDPGNEPYELSIELPNSGGLLDNSNVSLRGEVVGKVSNIALSSGGKVTVTFKIDHGTRVPRDSDAVVGALSVAGEQYLDLRPRVVNGPFYQDGDRVKPAKLSMPVPFSQLMTDLVGFADDLDPKDLTTIGHELDAALAGTGSSLRTLINNSSVALDSLEQTLPQTLRLLSNTSEVLDMVGDFGSDLDQIAQSSRTIARALKAGDSDLNTLLAEGPGSLNEVTQLARGLDGPMTDGFQTWTQLLSVISPNTPALGEFFPSLAFGASRASKVVSTGAIVILLDLTADKICRYGNAFRSPAVGGRPPIDLYRYCTKFAPDLLQRGPYNAPRRAGDTTATKPPGVAGNETSR